MKLEIECWTTPARLRSTINITGRSTSLSMKVTAWRVVPWLQVLGLMIVMACRLHNIIGLCTLAVYDTFTLMVASQAYAITKATQLTDILL